MLISHPHQFIYLKTHKTAGSSVEMALQPAVSLRPNASVIEKTHTQVSVKGVVGMRLVTDPAEVTKADRLWFNHMPAASVHAQIGDRLWSRYTKVAVVRNPFERMVSYFYWNQTLFPKAVGKDPVTPEDTEFSEVRLRFRKYILDALWATDEDIVTLNGTYCIDFSIRYERLQHDLDAFLRRADIDPATISLPETKVSRHLRQGRAIADYYDPDTVSVVRNRMAWVFNNFDYAGAPSEITSSNGGDMQVQS